MSKSEYLLRQIRSHVRLFFRREAWESVKPNLVSFLPYRQAIEVATATVAIPTDITASTVPQMPYPVPFNGTSLTLWNPVPRPSGPGWVALPHDDAPLWYQNRAGALLPAWNLYSNLLHLLTFREERESVRRDQHGRFCAGFSPRLESELLEVPAFNEGVATLVAAGTGLRQGGSPFFHLNGLVEPPTIILSHDCDLLRGNDAWTQAVRAYRIVQPVIHARPPNLGNLWWIARNAMTPRRYYFENVTGMINLESQFGFTSTFYLLNGTGGRYGARSGSGLLPDVVRCIPEGWDVGIHYNYDTLLNRDRLAEQLVELSSIAPQASRGGRAHYLRFDPTRSLPFVESFGVCGDASAGYSDRVGFRCGIGGCFQAFDTAADKPLNVWEIPLTVMDETLVNQYAEKSIAVFARLLSHLGRVGGALSLLFHPGLFHNPEFPRMAGLYHRLLIEARQAGARSITEPRLVERAANCRSC